MDRRDILALAHRRRTLADMAAANIRDEVQRVVEEQGVSHAEAIAAVFADADLLERAHQVTSALIPDQPTSDVAVQNV